MGGKGGDWFVFFVPQWMVSWQDHQKWDPHIYIYLPIKPNVYNTRLGSRHKHGKATVTSFVWKLELTRSCFLLQTKETWDANIFKFSGSTWWSLIRRGVSWQLWLPDCSVHICGARRVRLLSSSVREHLSFSCLLYFALLFVFSQQFEYT